MILALARETSYSIQELCDRDHVTLLALHDQLLEQEAQEAASDLTLRAIAAQGDSKTIQGTAQKLTGATPPPGSGIDALRKLAGNTR